VKKSFGLCFLRPFTAALLLFSFGQGAPVAAADDGAVMTINQLPVLPAEYRMVMQRRTAEVHVHFKQIQNRDDGPGYWLDEGAGGTPLQKLRELVEEELVRIKVIQGLAQKHGLLKDAGYDAFLEKLAGENARRKQAVAAKQVIYGPRQYREAAYFYIMLGDLNHKLQSIVAKEPGQAVSDADVTKYYEASKDRVGEKTLADLKPKIVDILQHENYERYLQGLCASARVEADAAALATLVPRIDPQPLPSSGTHNTAR
jgi:hypothetical protein